MSEDAALLELLQRLKERDYRFTTVTPATHARVLGRPLNRPPDLRDIFGWSRPFAPREVDASLLEVMHEAHGVQGEGDMLRSRYRVATLGRDLFLHSAFPTDDMDAVFFGPDTYRFVHFLEQRLPGLSPAPSTIVDMGSGSGAGGIVAKKLLPEASVTLVDSNPAALRLAAINAQAAHVQVEIVKADRVPAADLVIANPPYMIDPAKRAYRDGGDLYGGAVALDWARQAAANGSTMLLYTGAAVVNGRTPLADALATLGNVALDELDPDVFGEELERSAYAEVERIAVIGAVVTPTA